MSLLLSFPRLFSPRLPITGQVTSAPQLLPVLQSCMLVLLLTALLMAATPALAQTGASLPWDTFTQKLACMLSGNWVKWAAVIAIAIGGVMYGLGELHGPLGRVMQVGGGFSVAAGAVTVAGWLLGANPGACS